MEQGMDRGFLPVLVSKFTRPLMVLKTDSGCSKISFCINALKLPGQANTTKVSNFNLDTFYSLTVNLEKPSKRLNCCCFVILIPRCHHATELVLPIKPPKI